MNRSLNSGLERCRHNATQNPRLLHRPARYQETAGRHRCSDSFGFEFFGPELVVDSDAAYRHPVSNQLDAKFDFFAGRVCPVRAIGSDQDLDCRNAFVRVRGNLQPRLGQRHRERRK